jgi:predicted enzyme related to lactoylglutathione lyase
LSIRAPAVRPTGEQALEEMTMTGAFVWFDYVTTEINKAQGFYGELFGWTVQEAPLPDGPYPLIASGGRTIGGYLKTPAGAPPSAHWLAHLGVADAQATAQQITSAGGKVLKAPFKIGEFGTMAVVADPDGGAFALWQPTKPEPRPAPTTGTFCWNELTAKRPEVATAFYTAIGGFTAQTKAMGAAGAYTVLSAGGAPRAGLMGQPMPAAPHAWTPYVQVAGTDKAVARATKLGAKVVVPATDAAGVGRFAILVDPLGAAIGVLQP